MNIRSPPITRCSVEPTGFTFLAISMSQITRGREDSCDRTRVENAEPMAEGDTTINASDCRVAHRTHTEVIL